MPGLDKHLQVSQMLHADNPGLEVQLLPRPLLFIVLRGRTAAGQQGRIPHVLCFLPPTKSRSLNVNRVELLSSSRKLMSIAFMDMNPFPMRQIQNRRSFHLEKVRLELTELEAIRQTFMRERESSQEGRSFVSDDEEDN